MQNLNAQNNATLIKQHCTQDDDGINLHIDLSGRNITCAGVQVLALGMFVSTDNMGDDDEAEYCDGDLYVNWDASGLSDDAAEHVMHAFYSNGAFDSALNILLQELGFSAAAADISGSESGMQDVERASYDAELVADEVRAAFNV